MFFYVYVDDFSDCVCNVVFKKGRFYNFIDFCIVIGIVIQGDLIEFVVFFIDFENINIVDVMVIIGVYVIGNV